jgi:hypothetical protein
LALIKKLPSDVQLQIQEGTGLTMETFWKDIERARLAFVEWRYFYEDKNNLMVNVGFLRKLAAVVLAIVDRMGNANKR